MKIFDIGSHKGLFTDRYLDRSALCVLVEPNPNLANMLKKKYALISRVVVEELALSNFNGIIQMDICNDDQMSSCNPDWLRNLRYKNAGIKSRIPVFTKTIDELILKYGVPDHIKVDTEGFEFQVISGLSASVCPVQFEFISECFPSLTLPCLSRLREIGYTSFNIKILSGDFDPFSLPLNGFAYEKFIDYALEQFKSLEDKVISGMILAQP